MSFGRRARLVVVTGTLLGAVTGAGLGLVDGIDPGGRFAAPLLRLREAPAAPPPSTTARSTASRPAVAEPVRAAGPRHDGAGAKEHKPPKAKGQGKAKGHGKAKPKPGKPK